MRAFASPLLLLLTALLLPALPAGADEARKPSSASPASVATPTRQELKLDWYDQARKRPVPVLIYLPTREIAPSPAPVIVFSHGLGGSREGYAYLGRQWSTAGYVSVHVQHLGSDDSVWREAKPAERMVAVRRAAMNPATALARPLDVSFALDELTRLNQDPGSPLYGRLDLGRVGVAGHSFGGFTAMAIAGQTFLGSSSTVADPRVKAVIQMSAPVIGGERLPVASLDGIHIPVFHMTGTLDDSPVGETKAKDRRIPYDRMRHAETALVVFQEGDHMIFSGRLQPDPARQKEDEAFQKLIAQSTTAFWDAELRGQAEPRKWFFEGGFTKALGSKGAFEHKKAGE